MKGRGRSPTVCMAEILFWFVICGAFVITLAETIAGAVAGRNYLKWAIGCAVVLEVGVLCILLRLGLPA